MRILVIFLLALICSLVWSNSFAEENIYTWRDKNGVLNITDYAPPAGAKILDISPSYREETEELLRQRQNRRMERERAEQQRLEELREAEARKREAARRRQLERLRMEQEQEVRRAAEPEKKSKGY